MNGMKQRELQVKDWGVTPPNGSMAVVWASAAGVYLVGGLAFLLTSRLLTGEWSIPTAVIFVVASIAVAAFRWRDPGARWLKTHSARPPASGEAARLINVVQGLSDDLGIPAPRVLIIDEGPPNLMVTGGGRAAIAVRKSFADAASRTETEAAIAFCLGRIVSGEARRTTAILSGSPTRPQRVGLSLDVLAVSITRYPPGMIKALERCEPVTGRDAALWFCGAPPTHDETTKRIEALGDL
jgi:Zn-dependent protease with chaperone function